MKNLKNNKGITLIALIITIIVLLILAVVAISAVQGDGIIEHAKNARDNYGTAQNEENTALAGYLTEIENANGNNGNNGEKEEYTLTNNVNQEEISELASYLINNNFAWLDRSWYYFDIYTYYDNEKEEGNFLEIGYNLQNQIDTCTYCEELGENDISMYMDDEHEITYRWVNTIYDGDYDPYIEITDFPKIKMSDIETYLEKSIEINGWEGSTEDFMKAVQKVLDTFGE